MRMAFPSVSSARPGRCQRSRISVMFQLMPGWNCRRNWFSPTVPLAQRRRDG
jgi:hypothetical protein